MICGDCGFDNPARVDVCEACGSYLSAATQADTSMPFDAHLLSDVVDQLETQSPLLVSADDRVSSAVELMRDQRRGCVLVEEDGEVTGIFTEHDLLTKVAAAGAVPRNVAVGDVMTPDPVVLRRDDTLAVLVNKMVVGFFRHVPIVDADGKVNGIVSARDVLDRLNRLLQRPSEA